MKAPNHYLRQDSHKTGSSITSATHIAESKNKIHDTRNKGLVKLGRSHWAGSVVGATMWDQSVADAWDHI